MPKPKRKRDLCTDFGYASNACERIRFGGTACHFERVANRSADQRHKKRPIIKLAIDPKYFSFLFVDCCLCCNFVGVSAHIKTAATLCVGWLERCPCQAGGEDVTSARDRTVEIHSVLAGCCQKQAVLITSVRGERINRRYMVYVMYVVVSSMR